MTTTLLAPFRVPAPAVNPRRFGLSSAAVVIDQPGAHWQAGTEYTGEVCGRAGLWGGPCWTTETDGGPFDTGGPKELTSDQPVTSGVPFSGYLMTDCNPVGSADLEARALRGLQRGESMLVEEAVARLMADDDRLVSVSPKHGSHPVDALAALEQHVANNYSAQAIIHMTGGAATILGAAGAIDRYGSRLETTQGNVVSVGRYPVAPGGGTPATTDEWVWASGPVTIWRGGIDTTTVFDPATNDRHALAERSYAAAIECFVVAVNSTSGFCCPSGGP